VQDDRISKLIGRLERLEAEVFELRGEVGRQGRSQGESATKRELAAEAGLLRADVAALRAWGFPWLNSRILTTFPAIFDEFRGRSLRLLFRASTDGFSAAAFHRACDGRSPTLAIVCDEGGNVFGGFTPIAWESVGNDGGPLRRVDANLKSFVFTVKNPHQTGPMRFPLRPGRQGRAVFCSRWCGPCFGDDLAIFFSAEGGLCLTKGFGETYAFAKDQAPEIDPALFLAGRPAFYSTEIEVFEIEA
jgi:hypothetical protein